MAMMAAAFPILPGKTDDWRRWISEVNGPRRDEFMESRRSLGIRERTFLQSTPMGDLVIVTLEGSDPVAAFQEFGRATDPFSVWFREHVQELHGFDLAEVMAGPMPEQVLDSQPVAGAARA